MRMDTVFVIEKVYLIKFNFIKINMLHIYVLKVIIKCN